MPLCGSCGERVARTAQEAAAADADAAGFVTFDAFRRAISAVPEILLPAMQLQRALRMSFRGESWWETREAVLSRARAAAQDLLESDTGPPATRLGAAAP